MSAPRAGLCGGAPPPGRRPRGLVPDLFTAFNPLFLFDTGIWKQIDGAFVLPLLLCFGCWKNAAGCPPRAVRPGAGHQAAGAAGRAGAGRLLPGRRGRCLGRRRACAAARRGPLRGRGGAGAGRAARLWAAVFRRRPPCCPRWPPNISPRLRAILMPRSTPSTGSRRSAATGRRCRGARCRGGRWARCTSFCSRWAGRLAVLSWRADRPARTRRAAAVFAAAARRVLSCRRVHARPLHARTLPCARRCVCAAGRRPLGRCAPVRRGVRPFAEPAF